MKSVYIYHHLGLGDAIACNGLVRHYAETYDRVFVFSKPNNIKNSAYMYRDEPKIKLIALDDLGVRSFMQINTSNEYVVVGHTPDYFNKLNNNVFAFDEGFYIMANVPFEYKWDKFYYERNTEREKEVFYDVYGLKDDEPYVFIHESKERPINRNVPTMRVIKPDNMEVSLFDYLYLLEKASEIHVMNSSFMNLIDCIQLNNPNIFYHEYARPNINATLKLNWTIYK